MFTGLNAIIAVVISAAVVVIGAFLGGKREGRKTEQNKQVRRRAQQAKEVEKLKDEINQSSDTDVRGRLTDWMRDDD